MMRRACSVGSVSMDAEAGLVCSVSNLSSTFQASILWDKPPACPSERSSDLFLCSPSAPRPRQSSNLPLSLNLFSVFSPVTCLGGAGFSLPIRAQLEHFFPRVSVRLPHLPPYALEA